MSTGGRFEAQIVLTEQQVSYTDSNGTATVTVSAATFSGPTAVAAAFQTAIRAAAGTIGDTATVTISNGESGTGRCTIAAPSAYNLSIDWTGGTGGTDLRDILGFTANISAASSAQTGANACEGLWIPGVPKWSPHGDDTSGNSTSKTSTIVSTLRQSVGPGGQVYTLGGSRFYEYRGLRWEGVTRARARVIGESVPNESLEQFWLDTQVGEGPNYFRIGSKLRFWWDADDADDYHDLKLLGISEFDPRLLHSNFTGFYVIELPRLIWQES